MALGKRRGRPPKIKTIKKQNQKAKTKHWVDCDCGKWGDEVDGDVTRVICPYCVQMQVAPPPPPKQPLTEEQKKLKVQRKLERKARKEAILRGEVPPPKKDLGFGRGWHRKRVFTAEVDGETKYYSFGKEVTEQQYRKLSKEIKNKPTKPTAGWGRGWHLLGQFVSPEGDIYESGSLIKKAEKEPTEEELLLLMEQNK